MMEVNRFTFQPMLKSILEDISTAHFIALDFEFSGIHKQAYRAKKPQNSGKQTLQERYLETKAAAELYQILQVGLTCVVEDLENGSYELKPYNFNLSPLMTEKGLEIDRDIILQGSAIEFLLQNSFQMEVPFREGVPYLSRQEEARVRDTAIKGMDKSKIADIEIKSSDLDALTFVKSLRGKIMAWKAIPAAKRDEFLNISNQPHPSSILPSAGLNAFQRRLVYQTIRTEFPDLAATTKATFMQIKPLDATEAASLQIARLALTSEKIMRQTGLRWLFEAIAGGSLAAIDPLSLLPQNPENEAVKIDPAAEAASFSGLQEVLRTHRTILVGHNFFTDLIYMYATFFGPLPETFEAFAVEIHKLFPTIIDTKYLATADRGGGEKGLPKNPHNWASSLAELDEALKAQEVPLITTHPDHLQYEMEASLHEAGYDSYLTAKILVRLSANLSQQQQQKPKEKVNNTSKGSKKTLESSNSSKKTSKPTVLVETSESEEGGVELPNGSGVGTGAQEGGSSSRSSKNYAGSNNRNNSKEARDRRNMMPSFDSRFWDIYSNRVRVFGTQEGSMDLHKPW